jgi:hypothetical protein
MPWRHMGEWKYNSTFLRLGTRWRYQLHDPTVLNPGKDPPSTYWIGVCVVLRAGLDAVEKSEICCSFRESNPDRPACRYIDWIILAHFPVWNKRKLNIAESTAGVISNNHERWHPFHARSIFSGSELVTSLQTERGHWLFIAMVGEADHKSVVSAAPAKKLITNLPKTNSNGYIISRVIKI